MNHSRNCKKKFVERLSTNGKINLANQNAFTALLTANTRTLSTLKTLSSASVEELLKNVLYDKWA